MSFLLDTNVISELRKGGRCDRNVWEWRDNLSTDKLYLSVLTTGEIRKGIELCRVKDAPKARVFEKWLESLEVGFEERILPVTAEIADLWGRISPGANVSVVDGLIAATGAHFGLTVATRNTRDFQRCGVDYINPFEA
jgi:predicted nucleic acid-binding protein